MTFEKIKKTNIQKRMQAQKPRILFFLLFFIKKPLLKFSTKNSSKDFFHILFIVTLTLKYNNCIFFNQVNYSIFLVYASAPQTRQIVF